MWSRRRRCARRLAGRRPLVDRACGLGAGPGRRRLRPLVTSAQIGLHTDGVVAREQYERLARHLQQDGGEHVTMRFAQVARVIGEEPPASAYKHSAWRAGDPSTRRPYGSTLASWRRPIFKPRRASRVTRGCPRR
ncbi:DUF7662 domain-containing protein [Microbispora sp. CA-102843]|uniref:DUF7662 domain-containing protein n=1 Tax=Microbispora sp. CA-102843 TaxID=3239952 RepID=UPI003D8D5A3B